MTHEVTSEVCLTAISAMVCATLRSSVTEWIQFVTPVIVWRVGPLETIQHTIMNGIY
jgi:hypothetical protein